ncbi:DNA repair protein RadC [Petroclostridium sp. X23]|uniref:JAB domain-containing protein n=1 Tax=Petroclostridium sp. X23 TaxID=3045146 RepID=UPI0024AE1DE4|nr:DNA repair protein RadC [Petroclostridium sp. X23]WHH57190.1 DNA repair protein RadC [Petroclostridium sp. X23]
MKSTHVKGQICLIETNFNAVKEFEKSYSYILKERMEEYGVDGLMDAEILSLLTGISIEIIKKALDDFGMLDLMKYLNSMNLSKAQRRKLELLYLYHKRMLTSTHKEKPILNSSIKAGEFALTLFTDKVYECFYIICLDSQNRVNKATLVHEGTINEAPVYPRLIVEHALAYRANSVILSHNHPGGSQSPSKADIDVTQKIKQALDPINIKIIDHVIVADGQYISFAEKGLI